MKELKTITLSVKDNPIAVVCEGHVSVKAFNKAFRAEGWLGNGKYESVEYIYMTNTKRGHYKKCCPTKVGAKPYTYTDWD